MRTEFDSPSNRRIREDTIQRSKYTDANLDPGLASLMDRARELFRDRICSIEGEISMKETDKIFNQCLDEVKGAREAYEIWDILFDEYKPN
jgi:hypothetical protein